MTKGKINLRRWILLEEQSNHITLLCGAVEAWVDTVEVASVMEDSANQIKVDPQPDKCKVHFINGFVLSLNI